MNKAVKFGIWIMVVLAILALLSVSIFLSTFSLLGEPEKEFINQECDSEGVRRANLFSLSGNATANPSVHVSIDGCGKNYDSTAERVVFTAENPNLKINDVRIKGISFDTLGVEYSGDLMIFNQVSEVEYPDASLNLHIVNIERK